MIHYDKSNKTNSFCEFYQYYPDHSYAPTFYVYVNNKRWGMMVSFLLDHFGQPFTAI